MPRQISIPFEVAILAVLQQEKLITHLRIDSPTRMTRVQRIERIGALPFYLLWLVGESHRVAFIERIACRSDTFVKITASIHQRPLAWRDALSVLFIVCIIEVGQSQHMTELMADGADAVKMYCRRVLEIAAQLCRAGIVPQQYPIFIDIRVSVVTTPYNRTVGPPQIFVITIIVGAVTCYQEVHQIDYFVAIAVIVLEVDIHISRIHSGHQHFQKTVTIYITIVLTEVQRIGAHDVKLRLELAIRIV